MLIALDYDKTFTADPALWKAFIALSHDHGHRIVCVTMRYSSEPIDMPCAVFYTGRRAKASYAAENIGQVDIWIDDAPQWILLDSA